MGANERPTQAQRVKEYIQKWGSITQLEAIRDLGVMRLASRMAELKKQGFEFERDFVSVPNRWGESVRVARYKAVRR